MAEVMKSDFQLNNVPLVITQNVLKDPTWPPTNHAKNIRAERLDELYWAEDEMHHQLCLFASE